MLKNPASFVLGLSKSSTYPRGYALYLERVSGDMTVYSINLDVIGRYASGHETAPEPGRHVLLQGARTVARASSPYPARPSATEGPNGKGARYE
jgi:hypothetical protein